MSLSRSHADSHSVTRATESVGSATLVRTLATRSLCAATSVVSPPALSVWPTTCSLLHTTSVVRQTTQVVSQTTRVVWQPTEVVCPTTCLACRSTRACSTRFYQRRLLSSSVFHASSQSERTPNHALQRTAPRVTVAAISSLDPSRPSVALSYARYRFLRSTTQLPRHAPPSLSLGSLGD